MHRHPGGQEHTARMIALSGLKPPARWLDMGAGDGSAVRMLRDLGFDAEGIDLCPRGEGVNAGDYLHCNYESSFYDGILSQCSFYVSGDVPLALTQAAQMLKKGGRLVLSDVTENASLLSAQIEAAGFQILHQEDPTPLWREYYLELLWTQDNVCLPHGKKFRYLLFVCERM